MRDARIGIAALVIGLVPSLGVAVEAPTVLISEVAWAGSTASTVDEWVELFNPTDAPVDLTGWELWSTTGTPAKQAVVPSGTIPARGFFLIANNSETQAFSGGESVLNIAPDLITTSLSLSNTALQLELRRPDGTVSDIAGGGATPLAGTSGSTPASMERILPATDGASPTSWQTVTTATNLDSGRTDLGTPMNSVSPTLPAPTPIEPPVGDPEPPIITPPVVIAPVEPTPPTPPTLPSSTLSSVANDTTPTGTIVTIEGEIVAVLRTQGRPQVMLSDGTWGVTVALPRNTSSVVGERWSMTGTVRTGRRILDVRAANRVGLDTTAYEFPAYTETLSPGQLASLSVSSWPIRFTTPSGVRVRVRPATSALSDLIRLRHTRTPRQALVLVEREHNLRLLRLLP